MHCQPHRPTHELLLHPVLLLATAPPPRLRTNPLNLIAARVRAGPLLLLKRCYQERSRVRVVTRHARGVRGSSEGAHRWEGRRGVLVGGCLGGCTCMHVAHVRWLAGRKVRAHMLTRPTVRTCTHLCQACWSPLTST